jgi:uncharacterized coiled-coil protein SlyX
METVTMEVRISQHEERIAKQERKIAEQQTQLVQQIELHKQELAQFNAETKRREEAQWESIAQTYKLFDEIRAKGVRKNRVFKAV